MGETVASELLDRGGCVEFELKLERGKRVTCANLNLDRSSIEVLSVTVRILAAFLAAFWPNCDCRDLRPFCGVLAELLRILESSSRSDASFG